MLEQGKRRLNRNTRIHVEFISRRPAQRRSVACESHRPKNLRGHEDFCLRIMHSFCPRHFLLAGKQSFT